MTTSRKISKRDFACHGVQNRVNNKNRTLKLTENFLSGEILNIYSIKKSVK